MYPKDLAIENQRNNFRKNDHKFHLASLYLTSSIFRKKIIAIGLGILLLGTIPILESAFATEIPVGDSPIDLLLVESLDLIFVSNRVSDTISIIDASTLVIINTVPVGSSPVSSIYNPSTSLLYVTNGASNDVSVIDVSIPTNATIVDTIEVGESPFHLDLNAVTKKIYVANSFSDNVSVIDVDPANNGTTFHTEIKRFHTGVFTTGVVANESTNKIYVSNTLENIVSVIDGNTDTVVSTIEMIGPGGSTVDEINNLIFISNAFSSTISVIDGNTDMIIQTIPVGDSPRNIAINPVTNQIAVANNGDDNVSLIDGDSFTVLGALPVGLAPFGVEMSTASVIYTANQDGDSITVLDIGSNIPPTANAGVNQIVNEGDFVQLDGSGSNDFDGDSLIFRWDQTKGPDVILSSLSDVKPTFTAPDVAGNTLLEFQLIVNDGIFDSLADFVNVVIKDLTVFEVPLNPTGPQLEGGVAIQQLPANDQITFDFINPDDVAQGKLEDVKITSLVSGSNIIFDFVASEEDPDPADELVDPALYYEIENTEIDFSNIANLDTDFLPISQFLVDKNYNAEDRFSDGCPVVYSHVLNEDTNLWEDEGNPIIPKSNVIYVTNSGTNQVLVINGNTNELTASIDVGVNPRASFLVPTLDKLYVTNFDSGTVSVIDTNSNTVQKTIPNVGSGAIYVDSEEELVYVGNFGEGTISVINANTDTIVDTIVTSGGNINSLVVNPNLDRLYVGDSSTNELFIVDTNTNAVIETLKLSAVPVGIDVNLSNNLVYVAAFTSNSVFVIDGTTNTIIEDIPVGIAPVGVGVNSLTNKVFVANAVSGTVSVIDSLINAEIGSIDLNPGILGLVVNDDTDRVFVANQASGILSVLDGSKIELLNTLSLSSGIFTVALNELVPNPVRDPSNDTHDSMTNEILECAYIAKLPHLSKFAVGGVAVGGPTALFLGGSGGGSGAPISSLSQLSSNENFYIPDEVLSVIDNFDPYIPLSPMDPTLYENFNFPLTIRYNPYNGYPLAGFENTIKPNIVEVGTPITLEYILYEETEIQHFSLYSALYGSKTNPSESNIQILYNKDRPLEIRDSLNAISNVNVTENKLDDNKIQMIVEFTPIKENSIKDIIIRTWDPNLSSMDTIIRNAFEIVSENTIDSSSLTYEEPIIQELQSATIPIWIKNNAAWWSDQQISDDDFAAGIEYLIKQGIINIPGVQVGDVQSTEIPDWVQNNAGWWSESLITDDDFIEAMQWLVSNGVIKI